MARISRLLLALALGLSPALCQSPSQLKSELKSKEAAAKADPGALFAVGQWAAEKALANDAKRIYQAVLKLDPSHTGANEALGNALVEGKWIPLKEAEALRKKAQAAEFAAKGWVEVDDVWIPKDEAGDAKRGVFHHDGELVTKAEKLALQAGKVRHPDTGELIAAKDIEKAQNKYYPVGSEGRWVDLKEADTYHSDPKRPWVVRTAKGTIVSTLGLAKIQELQLQVDNGINQVAPLLGSRVPPPTLRPVVVIAATESEFRDIGAEAGDGTDQAGAFLMREEGNVPGVGTARAAVCENHKDWGTRYTRHAAALAYAHSVAVDAGAELPLWLLHGLGSFTSRFETDSDAAWLGKAHVQRGGVRNLKTFFKTFALNADMELAAIGYNLYQAGLCLAFAVRGGDEKVTAAMQAVTAALSDGGGKGSAAKAIAKLETELIAAEAKIGEYLTKVIAKAPQ